MRFIDFFAGIGGIRLGLEKAGHECVGFCEWDKYARQSYKAIHNTEGEWENHDIRTATASELPRADLWCFGFPCQDISVAGKQKGILEGERSNLFFEIIRLLQDTPKENRPRWLLAENVKNLLSVGRGWDFARCIVALGEVGYDVEWQLFNTKYSYLVGGYIINGIPQNRERVFLLGRLIGDGSRREVFPIPRADGENNGEHQVKIIDAYNGVIKNSDVCGTLTANGGLGLRNCGAFYISEPMPCLTPDREKKRQNGRRFKQPGEPMFTLTAQDKHGVAIEGGQIMKIGNYSPSGHNASTVVNPNGVAPTVMENHGTVTAVVVDETETNKNASKI